MKLESLLGPPIIMYFARKGWLYFDASNIKIRGDLVSRVTKIEESHPMFHCGNLDFI